MKRYALLVVLARSHDCCLLYICVCIFSCTLNVNYTYAIWLQYCDVIKSLWWSTSVLQLRACSNVAFHTTKTFSHSRPLSLSLSPSLPPFLSFFLSFSHTHTETVKSTSRVRAKDEAWHIKEKSDYFCISLALRFPFFLYFWFSPCSGYCLDADAGLYVFHLIWCCFFTVIL